MSAISAILRGDCWTELMLTAFADGRDGSQLQKSYAGLSVKTADGAADLVFQTVEAGAVQQDKLVVQNRGTGTAVLRGLRCVPERSDGAISIDCELPEGGALMPAGSSYEVEVLSTAPSVVGLHYTFVLALLEVEEHTERALISSRVLVGARACLMVTDPEGMAALNPEASARDPSNPVARRGARLRAQTPTGAPRHPATPRLAPPRLAQAPAFWPARLRQQWSTSGLHIEAPPWCAPPWKRELALTLPLGNSALLPEGAAQHPAQWVAHWEGAAVQMQTELAEAERLLLDGGHGDQPEISPRSARDQSEISPRVARDQPESSPRSARE